MIFVNIIRHALYTVHTLQIYEMHIFTSLVDLNNFGSHTFLGRVLVERT